MSDDLRRIRTAYHEAGHAAMGYMVGHKLGTVSIRPSAMYNGTAAVSSYRRGPLGSLRLAPVILQPALVRRVAETGICVCLAGEMAARLAPVSEDLTELTGYLPTPPDEALAERLSSVANLTRAEIERLDRSEATPTEHDYAHALKLHNAIAGDDGAALAYWEYLVVATEALVRKPIFKTLVEALVPVLLEREVISGRAVREVFAHALNEPESQAIAASRKEEGDD